MRTRTIPPRHDKDREFNALLAFWNGQLAYRALCSECARDFVRSKIGNAAGTCSKACYKRQHYRDTKEAQQAVRDRYGFPSFMSWENVVKLLRIGDYWWQGSSIPPYLNIRELELDQRSAIVWDSERYLRMPDRDEGSTKGHRFYAHPSPIQPKEETEREAFNRGHNHHASRLTADIVREIRTRYHAGESQRSIAKEYGITQSAVSAICRRKTWAHIT